MTQINENEFFSLRLTHKNENLGNLLLMNKESTPLKEELGLIQINKELGIAEYISLETIDLKEEIPLSFKDLKEGETFVLQSNLDGIRENTAVLYQLNKIDEQRAWLRNEKRYVELLPTTKVISIK